MKIGVITDIHSNSIALNEVLKEFEKINVDKIICCGDIIGIGPHPEETVQMLIQIKDKLIIVAGNHEQYLLNGLPEKVHDDKRSMNLQEIENHKWTHDKLSETSKKFINSFQLYKNLEIEDKKIYVIHYPIDKAGKYKKHIRNATIEEHKQLFSGINADIFIYGHTHTTCVHEQNDKFYINPGSLGCPQTSNIANCGILTIENEILKFESLKIEYDVKKVIQEIKKIKFPDYNKILNIFYSTE